MSAPIINVVPMQFFTDAGAVAASHKLYAYNAGTTDAKATYSDEALTSANANPIVLDAQGRATIFLDPAEGLYKFVLKNSDDSATLWTRDDVGPLLGFNSAFPVGGTAGTTIAIGDCVYLATSTQKWILADADITGRSNEAQSIGFALNAAVDTGALNIQTQGRVTGLTSLTAGSVYYVSSTAGEITATKPSSPAFSRAVGIADSTTSLVLIPGEAASFTTGPLPTIALGGLTGMYYLVDSDVTPVASTAASSPNEQLMTLSAAALTPVTTATGQFLRAIFWGEKAANANTVAVELLMWMDSSSGYQVVAPPTFTTSGAKWVCEGMVIITGAATGSGWGSLYAGAANTAMALSYASATASLTDATTWTPSQGRAVLQVDAATADGDVTVNGGLLYFGS